MKIDQNEFKKSLANCGQTSDQAVDEIYSHYSDFPWDDAGAYGNWLAQTYYYVRQASRVLAFAAAKCPLSKEPLHRVFLKGIKEEIDHEVLAANDLKEIGFSLDSFPELTQTALYPQALRYAIDADGPTALLGFFLPLEGLAAVKMGKEVDMLNKKYGSKSCSFLNVHCKLDVSHYSEGKKLLEILDLNELEVVRRNLLFSSAAYIDIIEKIKEQAKSTELKLKRIA